MTDTTNTPRLKKDGTPDRRGGKVGNKGNKYATGRKALPDYEKRKTIAITANEKEYELLKVFARYLKHEPEKAAVILSKLGTAPAGRAKRGDNRKRYTLRANEQEKPVIKDVIAIIKDRYELSYITIMGR
jgi:hypothetical protein